MIDLFNSLIGNIPMNVDLKVVLASLFFLLVLSEIFRFFEILLDFGIGRKR